MEDWGPKWMWGRVFNCPHRFYPKLRHKRRTQAPSLPPPLHEVPQCQLQKLVRRSSQIFLFILILETPPTLVNLKTVPNISAWMEDKSHIYIGRACRSYTSASYWQNPFSISSTCSREQAISRYEEFVKQDEEMLERLPTLGGMTMGCWCVPLPCHGQILIKYFMNYVKIV